MSIKIVTLCGSVRPGNYTAKALALVHDELANQTDIETEAFDFTEMALPLPGQKARDGAPEAFRKSVAAATGIVIATPEYHGGYSSVTKLAIENLGFPSVLAGKPVALLGVAAGQIGAIKSLEQLRSVVSHVGAIVLPAFVSIPNVRSAFDEEGNVTDPRIEKRVRSVATGLIDYIKGAVCPRFALEAMMREGVASD